VKIIASIEDPQVIDKILGHLQKDEQQTDCHLRISTGYNTNAHRHDCINGVSMIDQMDATDRLQGRLVPCVVNSFSGRPIRMV